MQPQKNHSILPMEKKPLQGGEIEYDGRIIEYSLHQNQNTVECLVVHVYGGEGFTHLQNPTKNTAVMTVYLSHVDTTPYTNVTSYDDYDPRYLKLLQQEIAHVAKNLDQICPHQKKILSGDGLGGLISLLVATNPEYKKLFDSYIAKAPATTQVPTYTKTNQLIDRHGADKAVETSGDQYQHLFYPEWAPLLHVEQLQRPTLILDWCMPSDHSLRFFEKGLALSKPVHFYMLDNLVYRHWLTPTQLIEEFIRIN